MLQVKAFKPKESSSMLHPVRVEVMLGLASLLLCCQIVLGADPTVHTALGTIQGTTMETLHGRVFSAFRGIPYAKPPIGELRFAPPEPISRPWQNVLNATQDGPACAQSIPMPEMSEDCLMLNVFTPDAQAKLPVIVHIHGGANKFGSAHSLYDSSPHYLLDHDVVLVTFHYRLGVFGFLSTGANTQYTGNFAYLDQILALKWVQQHISNFGGDPNLVTLMGMSAGAMAVSLHLVSPLSAGLFHRAIPMSGSATNHYSIDNVYWTRKVARDVSCPMFNPVPCLRNVTWQRIVDVTKLYEPYALINLKWNYEIDNHFLSKHPTELLASGVFNRVPILTGISRDELDFDIHQHINNTLLLNDISDNFDEYAPEFFLYNHDNRITNRLKQFYFAQDKIHIDASNITTFGKISSDSIIGHGVHRLVDIARRFTDVYYYRLDFMGTKSIAAPNGPNGFPIGIAHADDMRYVLPGDWYGGRMPLNSTERFIVDRITAWFANFAKTGKPDNTNTWEKCNSTSIRTMYNGVDAKMNEGPYADRYNLWDSMFPVTNGEAGRQLSLFSMIVTIAFFVYNFTCTFSRRLN